MRISTPSTRISTIQTPGGVIPQRDKLPQLLPNHRLLPNSPVEEHLEAGANHPVEGINNPNHHPEETNPRGIAMRSIPMPGN
mgnify:CR=1 FL=1